MESSENNEISNLNLPTPVGELPVEQIENSDKRSSTNKEADPLLGVANNVPSVNVINQKVQSIISDDGSNSNISDSNSTTTVLPPISTVDFPYTTKNIMFIGFLYS